MSFGQCRAIFPRKSGLKLLLKRGFLNKDTRGSKFREHVSFFCHAKRPVLYSGDKFKSYLDLMLYQKYIYPHYPISQMRSYFKHSSMNTSQVQPFSVKVLVYDESLELNEIDIR